MFKRLRMMLPPLYLSVSGTVVEVTPLAADKSDIKVGDQVMAIVGGGGYAGMPLHNYTILKPEIFGWGYKACLHSEKVTSSVMHTLLKIRCSVYTPGSLRYIVIRIPFNNCVSQAPWGGTPYF